MKRLFVLLLALCMLLALAACGGATKTLHCDGCGAEVQVDADSSMDEEWILYCEVCEKDLGLDNIIDEK